MIRLSLLTHPPIHSVTHPLPTPHSPSMELVTQFIQIEVEMTGAIAHLQPRILHQLQQYGQPLRWAIVAVDGDRQQVKVEAVVLSQGATTIEP
ncbi:MAG: hypothetical protein MUF49_29605 [Oculatellaceae cyanobacterium Prado106]|nr:hypothetical protein [Oculatellaceae cyanobacterium Prado106]